MSNDQDNQRVDAVRDLRDTIDQLSSMAKYAYTALGIIYSGILISQIPATEIINKGDVDFILHITLIFMYLSWTIGIGIDINTSKIAYVGDPSGKKFSIMGYVNFLALLATGIILVLARHEPKYFATILLLFSLSCLFSLSIIDRRVRLIIEMSKTFYEERQDYFGLEILNLMRVYATGWWVWLRQAILLMLIFIVEIICWNDYIAKEINALVVAWYPKLQGGSLSRMIPAFAIVVFLVIAEVSQWYMRLITTLPINALAKLKKTYILKRRKSAI